MLNIPPLFKVKNLSALSQEIVMDFHNTGETEVFLGGTEEKHRKHKIYVLGFIIQGMLGKLAEKDQIIFQKNEKIKELGIELSKLKRSIK